MANCPLRHIARAGSCRGPMASASVTAAVFKSNFTGTATDADDRIVYNRTTGDLFFDKNGNGAGGAIKFATLSNKAVLTAADFFVI